MDLSSVSEAMGSMGDMAGDAVGSAGEVVGDLGSSLSGSVCHIIIHNVTSSYLVSHHHTVSGSVFLLADQIIEQLLYQQQEVGALDSSLSGKDSQKL
jgi:hypothetical protein